jgi:hypothetical protein
MPRMKRSFRPKAVFRLHNQMQFLATLDKSHTSCNLNLQCAFAIVWTSDDALYMGDDTMGRSEIEWRMINAVKDIPKI